MPTLRSIFKSADSCPHPATVASGDPSPSPATDPDGRRGVGDGSPSIVCSLYCTPSGPFDLDGARYATYTCASCGWRAEYLATEGVWADVVGLTCKLNKNVGEDVPLEGGVNPSSPTNSTATLIKAAAEIQHLTSQLAAVHAALDQYEDDLARRKHGGVVIQVAISSVYRAVGR